MSIYGYISTEKNKLVGMKYGAVTLKNSVTIPQNVKHTAAMWPSRFTSITLPESQ